MPTNIRRNLGVTVVAGGTNPLTLRLQANPVILPIRVGVAIAAGMLALVGQGGTPAYAYSIASGSLPTGLSLNATTGFITGTPTVIGQVEFIAEVEDATTTIFEANFEINVDHTLIPVADTPTDMESDTPYSYQFAVSGATGTLTWSTTGTLPSSISIDSATGILSGTTSTPGTTTYNITVTAADSGTGDSIDMPCSFTLWPEMKNTVSPAHSSMTVGVPRVFTNLTLGFQGGKPPYTLSVYAGNPLPAGVTYTFDPNTGIATVNASLAFASTYVVWTATDDLGYMAGVGQYITAISALPSTDASNALGVGSDNALFVSASSGGGTPYGVASGTNTYAVTLGLSGYTTGQLVSVKFTNANTSTVVTLNSDSLGAKTVLLNGLGPPIGYLAAVSTVDLVYNGTNFDIIGETNTGPAGATGATGATGSAGATGATGPTGPTNRFIIPIAPLMQSTVQGSTNKLAIGRVHFDPTLTNWRLTGSSVATLYAELETSNATIAAAADLWQLTGTGAPQLIATLPTTTSTTPALVSVSVSTFFNSSTGVPMDFEGRVWLATPNGNDFATVSNMWIEIQP